LIVDDHEIFSWSLAVALGPLSDGRIEVTGTARNASEALEAIQGTSVDLVILDWFMPGQGGNGKDFLVRARQQRPTIRTLVLSGLEDLAVVQAALAAGADAFLPKRTAPDALAEAALAVAHGCSVIPSGLLGFLLGLVEQNELRDKLNDEEATILGMLARGLDTREIAAHLFVSERTAKRRIAQLLHRLGVDSRAEAAALAGRLRIGTEE
jgi:DNA-binding NarL/FixJ family response regulator